MNRIQRLQEQIKEGETWTISHPVDLYYLTGLKLSLGRLCITKQSFLLGVDGRYSTYACERLKDKVVLCERGKWDPLFKDSQGVLVFDSLYESYSSYETLVDEWGMEVQGRKGLTSSLRIIKDEEELILLRKAAFALEEGFSYLTSQIRKGITERQLSCKLQAFWLEKMGLAISFDPIVAFGPHTTLPHAKPRDVMLKEGDLVLVDIGVAFESYQSDMTRMIFFGEPTPEQRKLSDLVLKAHTIGVENARPGVKVSHLDYLVRNFLELQGFKEEFSHSLGHGIGLDVHESPMLRSTSEDVLKEGMVITIEPGLYIPGMGGMRLENTYLVTKTGMESLMVSSLEPLLLPVR